jgi:hypothetical protein
MRIVTRPDFDGIVCAVLLYSVEAIDQPIKWVSPNDMQKNRVDIQEGDIIANLPYNENCSLWFDHHFSNQLRRPVAGLFRIAPSAAGIVFEHYQDRLKGRFTELIREADKIDAAELSLDEILQPENHPFVLLSMTVHSHMPEEEPYWNHLVKLLRERTIQDVLEEPDVKLRCDAVIKENREYKALLKAYTTRREHVSITDFRSLDSTPYGNRFLIYSLFPETSVSVKIGFDDKNKETVVVKVGHSILNRTCNVNVGQMLSYFEGGGHKGAGACRFHRSLAEDYLPRIIDILLENDPDGSIVVKTERSDTDRRKDNDRRQTSPTTYLEAGHMERRKKPDRRSGKEQRKGWERLDQWQSRRVPE